MIRPRSCRRPRINRTQAWGRWAFERSPPAAMSTHGKAVSEGVPKKFQNVMQSIFDDLVTITGYPDAPVSPSEEFADVILGNVLEKRIPCNSMCFVQHEIQLLSTEPELHMSWANFMDGVVGILEGIEEIGQSCRKRSRFPQQR